MRRWLPFLFVLVLAACSGSDGGSATATVDDAAAAETTTVAEPAEATFTSVPYGEYSVDHVSEPPVSFDTSPAIGGAHYPFWQNCGFYDRDVAEGAAVHSMEHGAVWITYNPDLISDAELEELAAMAQADGKLLITAYDHPEKLVLSAWSVQHREADLSPSDATVAEFIAEWRENPALPEAAVTCQEALGFPPSNVYTFVADGSELPEEWR